MDKKMTPVLKWAGGKRQIINRIKELLPKEFDCYYEPFVGAGALFLELEPKKAVINDINEELISIYKCLENEKLYSLMIQELDKHEINHNDEYYYIIRELDRNPNFNLEPLWKRAARVIYLNKACFNGLYRVNSKGYFNVPSGKKEKVKTYDKCNLRLIHEYFLRCSLQVLNVDFVEAIKTAQKGDFIYFDPPYDIIDNKNSFTSYSKYNFRKDDQKRLADCVKELTKRGIKCMVSNHNTKYIQELYKDFNIKIIHAKRIINADGKNRGTVEEVLITNY